MANYKCSKCGNTFKVRKKKGVPLKKWRRVICGNYGTRMYLQKEGK